MTDSVWRVEVNGDGTDLDTRLAVTELRNQNRPTRKRELGTDVYVGASRDPA
jgi:hypothetical protein